MSCWASIAKAWKIVNSELFWILRDRLHCEGVLAVPPYLDVVVFLDVCFYVCSLPLVYEWAEEDADLLMFPKACYSYVKVALPVCFHEVSVQGLY